MVVIEKPPVANFFLTDDEGNEKQAQVPFYSVAFSPDGRTIAAGSDRGLAYLVDTIDTNERQIQVGLDDSPNYVTALAFDSSGSRIVFVAKDRFLVVQLTHNRTTTEPIQIVKRDGDTYYALQFHDQDATLRSFDSVAYFSAWSLHTPGTVSQVRIHYPDLIGAHSMELAKSGALSADGQLIAFGAGSTRPMFSNVPIVGAHDARLFVVRAGETVPWLTLRGHSDYVNAVAFNPSGDMLASGSSDQTVRLWQVTP
jgi:WD40 repeat protein